MRGLIVSGCVFLMCTTSVHAQRPMPLPPALAPMEQWCAYFGTIVQAMAVDRDRRIPLAVSEERLGWLMIEINRRYPDPQAAESLQVLTGILKEVYAHPQVTPPVARQVFTSRCIAMRAITTEADRR